MRYLRYLALFLLLSCQWLSAQEVVGHLTVDTAQTKVIYVHDTVYVKVPMMKAPVDSSRIIMEKGIGRYNRRITNYRFLPKGKWIGGVTFSVYNYDSDDSRLLFSLIKDMDIDLRMLSVDPFIGYVYKDNQVVGFKFGYSRVKGDLNSLAISVDDINVSLKDIKYSDDLYSFALFHRSYVGVDAKGTFALFNETSLGYNVGTGRFQRIHEGELKYTDTTVNQLKVVMNPGVAIRIMPNVQAELSFGVAGFTYNWEKQKKSTGEIGKRTNSGANFKLNLLNINIGITVCI